MPGSSASNSEAADLATRTKALNTKHSAIPAMTIAAIKTLSPESLADYYRRNGGRVT